MRFLIAERAGPRRRASAPGRRSRARRTGRAARRAGPSNQASAAAGSRPERPASSGASSSRAVTIAEVGLPGRPSTSRPPARPNQTGLPGLIATVEKISSSPSALEHRLGEIPLADRGAAGDDDQVGRLAARLPAAGSIVGRSSGSRRRCDVAGAPILRQRRHARRHAVGNRARAPAPCPARPARRRWRAAPASAGDRPPRSRGRRPRSRPGRAHRPAGPARAARSRPRKSEPSLRI